MKDKTVQAVFWLGAVLIAVAAVVGFVTGIAFVNTGTPPPDTQACQVQCPGGSADVSCVSWAVMQCTCRPDGTPLAKCVEPANEGE